MSDNEAITVLVTSAGGAAALNCIKALRQQTEIPLRIVAIDTDRLAAGLFLVDKGYQVLSAENEGYISQVLEICRKEAVKVVFPTFSRELPIFASDSKAFENEGISLLISQLNTIRTFEDKWLAHQFFKREDIPTPETWLVSDVPSDRFPLYLKPAKGSGSRDNHIIDNWDELNVINSESKQLNIVQEFIRGREFTVDILADRNSQIISAVPRERLKVKSGLAVIARTVRDEKVYPYIDHIISCSNLVGPLNIQYIHANDQYYFIDVNTRFAAGGLPLAIASGVNIPLMALKLALGIPVAQQKKYRENIFMVRYYTELFLSEAPDGSLKYLTG